MNVLVTGGAGFIGSHTVDLLVEKGYKVTVLDNLEKQVHNGKPDYLNEKARYIWGDITSRKDALEGLKGADYLVHLAAMVGVGQSMYSPVRYARANTIGTSNLYEIILRNEKIRKRLKGIVVASSKSIYGEGSYECKSCGPVYPGLRPPGQLEKNDWEVRCPACGEHVKPVGIREDKPPQNLSIYALSKYDTERIAVDYGSALGIPTAALRYFNVYGPRQSLSNPYTGVAAIFISRIKNGNPPIISEDGKQLRDFIFVEDVAKANVLSLESWKSGVFNIGFGEPIGIGEIAKILIKIHGSKAEPFITNQYRIGDNRHDFSDISKARKELKFRPKTRRKEGLRKLVEWSEGQTAIDRYDSAAREFRRYFGG